MYLGEDRNEDLRVVGVGVRMAPHGIEPWVWSYGVIGVSHGSGLTELLAEVLKG
jgi:hypothetical protein